MLPPTQFRFAYYIIYYGYDKFITLLPHFPIFNFFSLKPATLFPICFPSMLLCFFNLPSNFWWFHVSHKIKNRMICPGIKGELQSSSIPAPKHLLFSFLSVSSSLFYGFTSYSIQITIFSSLILQQTRRQILPWMVTSSWQRLPENASVK